MGNLETLTSWQLALTTRGQYGGLSLWMSGLNLKVIYGSIGFVKRDLGLKAKLMSLTSWYPGLCFVLYSTGCSTTMVCFLSGRYSSGDVPCPGDRPDVTRTSRQMPEGRCCNRKKRNTKASTHNCWETGTGTTMACKSRCRW